jgi:serine/threonine-protein kinase
LRQPDGNELRDVVRQPKRLALLGYLAVERAPRFHRRDSLLGLFWPEIDDAHARASLRRTLHFLRTHLGDDVLEARGDEVGISIDRVWCDVSAFTDAIEQGALETALDLYQGDLLEGFFVASAPGFERWLEDERERLRRLAAGAAWQLAERCEAAGDVAAAGVWGRRAAAMAPDDEIALRRMLALFDRLGDRAAAVQVYDDFARRLKTELELAPSPETQALIEGIRSRVATRPPTSAAPAPPVALPNRVAILPFTIRGGPHLAYLREGMVDLLTVKLDGAGDLRTVDPHALLGPANALGVDEIDPVAARALAQQFGAGLFILGSVVNAGSRLLVRMTMYATPDGNEVRVDAEAEGEAGLSALLDDAVRRMLAGRTTSVGGHLGRLGAATTRSLTALKAYLAGERAYRQGRYLEAADAYERAVTEDPEFALAHYRLGVTRAVAGRPIPDTPWADPAQARRFQHLTVHVRLLFGAQAAWGAGDLDLAERRYLAVLDERPEDVDAWFGLGNLLFDGNPLRGRSAAAARDALERTVALDPRHVGAMAQLARLAAMEGRGDDVERLVARVLELSPEADEKMALLALRAGTRGTSAAQSEILNQLAGASPSTLARSLINLALAATQPEPALDLLEQCQRLTAAPALLAFPPLVAAHLAVAHGLDDRATRALQVADRLDHDAAIAHRSFVAIVTGAGNNPGLLEQLDGWTPGPQPLHGKPIEPWPAVRVYLRGLVNIELGRGGDATACADELEAIDGSVERGLPRALAAGIRAREALSRGGARDAVLALESIRLGPWMHFAAWSPFAGLSLERMTRGQALIAAGRLDEGKGWLAGLGQRSVFELVCGAVAGRSAG